ncbi:MAG: integrase [bacterium]|jgi:integrase
MPFKQGHLGYKKKGNKLPLTENEYKRIRKMIRGGEDRLKSRNLLLLSLQTNTSLRVSDVLKLTIENVYHNGNLIDKFWLEQQKTKDSTVIRIIDCVKRDIEDAKLEYERLFYRDYFDCLSHPLFPSWKRDNQGNIKPLSYQQYLIIFKQWVSDIGLNPDLYGTHSLRSTIPVEYYRKTKDVLGASKMFGHRSTTSTAAYLESVAKEMALEHRDTFFFDG